MGKTAQKQRQTQKQTQKRRARRPVVEEIEPRILYSADFAPALVDAAALAPAAEQRTVDVSGEFAHNTQDTQSRRHEIVFVDPATPDYQKLIDDIRANTGTERNVDVVLLDANKDGIKQISQALATRSDISAVHLVSHGSDGAVQLGSSTLNFDSLLKNAKQIKGWSNALTADADLLIYGCDVAQSADGKALVDALSRLTGADVAASEDMTGAAAQGGDWTLEYQDGQIATALAVSAAEQQSYQGVLQSASIGSETRANQTTTNAQFLEPGASKQVAVAQDGSFVVTWVSQNQDTATSTGVYARRYAADGTALSAEILVNQTTVSNQREPAVAIDPNGNFVVTWTSQNQVSGTSGRDTYARQFSAAGSALGNEFLVNTTTAGDTDGPAIAMAANGRFVISWSDLGGLDGSAAGAYLRVYDASGVAQTGEVQVNTTTAGNQYVDTVAIDASGNFVVVGTGDNVDGSGRAIYGQRFAADGTKLGAQFTVNTSTTGDQIYGSVAMNASGAFVVSWTDSNSNASDIFAQRFNADGSKAGAQFQVNSTTANAQQYSTAGMDGNGNLVFTWASTGQDSGATVGVYQREFNADGSAHSVERLVNTTIANDQTNPSMAMNALGQYVVAWQGNGPGDADGIFFQRYSSALIVDTISDTADGTTTSISNLIANKGADGRISLREALAAANNTGNTGGPDRIYFNIPGAGVQTINVTSVLPNITDTVVIDGTTQPGFAGTPLIEIDGQTQSYEGLYLDTGSDGSTIKGLAINRFMRAILINTSSDNVIAGNFLGTDATGTVAKPNWAGVAIRTSNNVIGGTTAADRNIISGNSVDGIQITGASGGSGNVVMGNYIGLDVTGTVDLGNANQGIALYNGAKNNTIGGTGAGEGNVISGNNGEGVRIVTAGTTGNVVLGNLIGTNAAGTAAVANSKGVWIDSSATGNTIGGTVAGEGNVIAYNTLVGVALTSTAGSGNAVLGNAIYSNGGLGIDLLENGVTGNDGAKSGGQPNLLMDFPVVQAAVLSGATLTVSGYIGIAPNDTDFAGARVEFFKSPDAAGANGEGQVYLGFLTADANGNFSGALTVSGLAVGDRVSTTATDPSGNTSEFGVNYTVTPLNTAPVLADTVVTLNAVNEDAGAPVGAVGTLVSSLVGGVSDADGGALQGIAITAADAGNGSWWYSTNNGASWSALGTPSAASSRLLAADANTRIYFQPNANYNGTLAAAITFRGWDRTSGVNGSMADTGSNGGTTAFSSATDTAALTVTPVNDAPVLDNSGSMTLTGITEDDLTNGGDVVATIIASAGGDRITDVDSGAVEGIAVTALVSGNGTWEYSTDGGGSWNGVGAVSNASALLLRASDRLRFVPDGLNADSPTVSFRAWDQSSGVQGTKVDASSNGGSTAFSSAIETASLAVSAVNDAPVLTDTVVTLSAVNEDAAAPMGAVGTLVSAVVGGVSDVDSGALAGIAITAADAANGTWLYSTNNGASWNALGSPSAASSRLLAADATTRIYFQPNADYNGTLATAITFRAWDQSSGANGGTADTTSNGGTTAYSSATDTASLTVNPVNDAPTITNAATVSLAGTNEDTASSATTVNAILTSASWADTDSAALKGIAVTAVTGNGTWQYSTDGMSWTAFGPVSGSVALLLDSASQVRYVPDGQNGETATFGFQAWDQTTGVASTNSSPSTANPGAGGGTSAYSSESASASIVVSAVNDAPSISGSVAGQAVNDTATLSPFATVSIGDVDNPAQPLNLSVTLDTAAKGAFTAASLIASGFTDAGGGVYTFSGTAAAATTAIHGLVFDPADNRVTPGSTETTIFTISVDDGVAAPVSDATTTVVSTSVDDAPSIAGSVAGQAVNDTATISPFTGVTIGDVDNPAQSLSVSVTLDVAAKGAFTTLNGFTDAGGGVYTFSGTAAAATSAIQGLVFDPADNRVIAGSTETTTFTISVDDGSGPVTDNTTTVVSTSVNDDPVAMDDSALTDEDTVLNVAAPPGVLANDSDPDTVGLVVSAVEGNPAAVGTPIALASGAMLTLNADGSFSYDPNGAFEYLGVGESDTDTFVYEVADGSGGFDTATVSVTVDGVNDAPTGADASVTLDEDSSYIFVSADFGFGDADASDNLQAVRIVSLPLQGSLTLSGVAVGAGQLIAETDIANGELVYTPAAEGNGVGYASFIFRANDGTVDAAAANTITIDVTAVNDAPAFTQAGNQSVNEDAGAQNVAGFASASPGGGADEAGQVLSYSVSNDNNALFSVQPTINAAGTLSYTLAAEANGVATVTVQVSDNGGTANGGADTAAAQLFTITVNAVNDAPTFALGANQSVAEDAGAQSVAAFATAAPGGGADEAGQVLSYVVSNDNNGLFALQPSLDAAGNLTYTSAPDAFGSATVTVYVTDGGGTANGGVDVSATQSFTITVSAVNDAPVLGANALTLNQGDRVVLSAANLSASDVDNAAAGLSFVVSNITNGRFEYVSSPGVAITSFTQADVTGGQVRFVHDGSGTAPAYEITVSDGALSDGPRAASITFDPVPLAAVPPPVPVPVVNTLPPAEEPPAEEAPGEQPESAAVVQAVFSPGRIEVEGPDAQLNQFEGRGVSGRRYQPVATLNTFVAGPRIDPTLQLLAAAPANLQYLPSVPVDWTTRSAFPDAAEEQPDRIQVLLEQVQMGGMALSVGVVWWASRISGLLGSLLASAPAWRHIDPLPVVGRDEDEDKKWYDPEDRDADANELAIDDVFEGAHTARGEQQA